MHTPSTPTVEEPLIKGHLAHRLIEEHLLKGISMDEAFRLCVEEWLEDQCQLPILRASSNAEGISIPQLVIYAKEMAGVLYRCLACYEGDDAIRNRDNSVPKDPLGYPPKVLTSELERRGLPERRYQIDVLAARLNANFERLSLANIAAIALAYAYAFKLPDWVESVIAVEYDLANIPIAFEGDRVWTGRIDLVLRTKEGALVIVDNKSGSKKPGGLDVYYHAQLNLYVAHYLEHTGELADFIGIYHMPSGEFVLAEVDTGVVEETLVYYRNMQINIDLHKEEERFLKRMPTDFLSPCIRRDRQSGVIERVCPYLRQCWPGYAGHIEEELVNLI